MSEHFAVGSPSEGHEVIQRALIRLPIHGCNALIRPGPGYAFYPCKFGIFGVHVVRSDVRSRFKLIGACHIYGGGVLRKHAACAVARKVGHHGHAELLKHLNVAVVEGYALFLYGVAVYGGRQAARRGAHNGDVIEHFGGRGAVAQRDFRPIEGELAGNVAFKRYGIVRFKVGVQIHYGADYVKEFVGQHIGELVVCRNDGQVKSENVQARQIYIDSADAVCVLFLAEYAEYGFTRVYSVRTVRGGAVDDFAQLYVRCRYYIEVEPSAI